MSDNTDLTYSEIDLAPVATVIDCWKEGMVDHEISEKMGIPIHYIAAVRKVLDLKANYRHTSTRARRKAARAMAKDGQTTEEIASILKAPVKVVEKWLSAETV